MTAPTAAALFVPDGDRFVPTEYARGPWDPGALHGGPVTALVAGVIEAQPSDEAMHVTRLTVDLIRPVPLAPVTVSCRLTRPGRKIQILEAVVTDGQRELVWARALRIRRREPDDGPAPGGRAGSVPGGAAPSTQAGGPGEHRPPGPDAGYGSPSPSAVGQYVAFHNAGAELRYVVGSFDTLGPATVWARLAVPVVAGQDPTPLQRVAAAADFGNGVSAELDFARYLFINPDLTITLHRPARGQWVCLEAATRIGVPGVGVAQSALYDVDGPIGRAVQSLLVEPRS